MILDTNAVSALVAGDHAARQVIAQSRSLFLPAIVIGEYEYGILGSSSRKKLQAEFDRLILRTRLLNVERKTATEYATIRQALKQIGQPIPANDLWIAALARQHDLLILSRDTHFDRVEGVTRIGW